MTTRRGSGTGWMIGLLLISGNPSVAALVGGAENLLLIAAAVLGLAVLRLRVRLRGPRVVQVSAALVGILVVQCFQFQFWPVATIFGMVTRLFIAAAVVALVEDFPAAYVRAIAGVAAYCLVMWTIDQSARAVGIDFRSLFVPIENALHIEGEHRFALVYTFTIVDGTHRNAGFFSEPGLFAGYLLLGLLWLLLDHSGVAPGVRRRQIVLVLAALATTFSTAGYVTLPVVLAVVGFERRVRIRRAVSRKAVFVAVLAVTLGGLWLVSKNTDFLEDKLEAQYEGFIDETRNYEITRFGGAMLDVDAIQERPYLGWGLHESTKFAQTPELAEWSPSGGITGWARSFGIVGLAVFLLAIGAGLRPLVGGNLAASMYATAVIAVIAQPNTFLNYPAFLALMFLRRPLEHCEQVVADPEPVRQPGEHVIDAGAVQRAQ